MYLKSITLKGFKSFPERTRLEFGPGVSVVVGPNGSGKSNITDAVLWALGEQSPVAVRGQSMQDVIFAGAPGRQASKAAEVELVLDDSEGSLGLGVPEVSILRRLERTGEGEYRLAGARCRLVDVIELLSDTGLGKEMHSVISQGRVESIVTSKPRDRRLLIEEAAGLGKHRKRRRRAQLKLARTHDNLDRALDVEREARSHLRPLKRQAEAAEVHARVERQLLETRWELARDDLRAERGSLEHADARAAGARGRREQVEQELEQVATRRQEAEERLAGRAARREELSRRCFVAQSAAERVSDRAETVRRTAAALETRLTSYRGLLESLEAASERGGAQPEAASEEQLEQARTELLAAERALEAARREAARVHGELAAVNEFLRSQERSLREPVLADQLEVDSGYELAVAAALDGRLRAAVVSDRAAAETLLDRVGEAGGRALVPRSEPPTPPTTPPTPEAELLLDHVRGPDAALAAARSLLHATWVVDSLKALPQNFEGVAVTPQGRVWSAVTGELRQAPAVGEERVLAERNRREQLAGAAEAAAGAEQAAAAAVERAADAYNASLIKHRGAGSDRGPQLERVRQVIGRDEAALAAIGKLVEVLAAAGKAISVKRAAFESALTEDRQAGEDVAVELRRSAQEEAKLQAQLHREHEALTEAEVERQRARDRTADCERELRQLADRLKLEAEPASEALGAEERETLSGRLDRLARRREQLGPVNPLAEQEYAEAVEHVEELERQRNDLETALRELEKLIADTDRQIRETFERTFAAAARNFEQVVGQLFPGGEGRLRLVAESERPASVLGAAEGEESAEDVDEGDEVETSAGQELLGVEIEINPAGKEMKRLSLLSGGEKSLTALAFLFGVFLARPCPFYILDEVEAALDDLNIDRFLDLLRSYSSRAQFIVVTHQKRTMEAADILYGVSMGQDGLSKVISRRLPQDQEAA